MKKSILAGLMAAATTVAFAQTSSTASPGTPPQKPSEAPGYASPNPADKAAGSGTTKGSATKSGSSTSGSGTSTGGTSGSGMSTSGTSGTGMSTGSTSGSRSSTGAASGSGMSGSTSTGTTGAGTPPKEPAAASGYASPVPADQKAGSGKK